MINIETFLRALKISVRDLPFEERHLSNALYAGLLDVLRLYLDAYMIDIFWEEGQGINTKLRSIRSFETERHGYDAHDIYDKATAKLKMLSGLCYSEGAAIWIRDASKGIKNTPGGVYRNEYGRDPAVTTIEASIIYEYNKQEPIYTEICCPLTIGDGRLKRTFGVLNIELGHDLAYSTSIAEVIESFAESIALLQLRVLVQEAVKARAVLATTELAKLAQVAQESKREHASSRAAFLVHATPDAGARAATRIVNAMKRLDEKTKVHRPKSGENHLTQVDLDRIKESSFGVVVTCGKPGPEMVAYWCMRTLNKKILHVHVPLGPKDHHADFAVDVREVVRDRYPEDWRSVEEALALLLARP